MTLALTPVVRGFQTGVSANSTSVTSTVRLVAIRCAWCMYRLPVDVPLDTPYRIRCPKCKAWHEGIT